MSLGPGRTAAQATDNPGDAGGPMSIDPKGPTLAPPAPRATETA